jgi:hypothetical protein
MNYHESQRLRAKYAKILLALPPAALLFLTVRQMVFKLPWGHPPPSNGDLLFLTILLTAVYLRLITVRLVTDVDLRELSVGLKGLWRRRRIPLPEIRSAAPVDYDPIQEYGGYGIRSGPRGQAYIADGNRAVQIELQSGAKLLIGSQQPEKLAAKIMELKRG